MRTVSMILVSASLLRHEATRCGPNVKIHLQAAEDATGAAVYGEGLPVQDGTCMPVGADIKSVKICGPASFSFSRMTCNNHDYKAHVAEGQKNGDCEVVSPGVTDGHTGSITVTCGASR